MDRNKKFSGLLVLVSENKNVDTSGLNIDNRNLEIHNKSYTQYLFSLFLEFCNETVMIDDLTNLAKFLPKKKDVVVFSIWSGAKSRNRMMLVPAICESLNIPYIGADSYAKTICQDKFISRIFAKRMGFEVPNAALIEKISDLEIIDWILFPIIVKPNMEGTSIGVRLFQKGMVAQAKSAIKTMFDLYDKSILVEEFIPGKEISILVYGTSEKPEILGAVELINTTDSEYFYNNIASYQGKRKLYKQGHIKRVDISHTIKQHIYDIAKKTFSCFGKMDFLRIDGRLDGDNFTFIEFSPLPNFKPFGQIATLLDNDKNKIQDFAYTLLKYNINQTQLPNTQDT
ncbi:MAG: ATP-grasp domain-containing protein [Alcanivoracaceae bacterium]|nr:ATP-grasp domain-containing protein [Alcanivoracaceae bacterium]